ncbi:MAG: hypothetical protein Kow0013_14790 [Pararhodobacter sp.]
MRLHRSPVPRLLTACALGLVALGFPQGAARAQGCAPTDLPPLNACSGPARVSLAIVGDVLLHTALAERGYLRGFETIWGDATPLLRAADLAIANLEGPLARGMTRNGEQRADPGPRVDGTVYSDYPAFNYHPVVAEALREAGLDVVTTANNHALDRGSRGVTATLDALDAARIAHVGAVRPGHPRWQPLRLRTAIGPLSLIACTFGTNGIPDPAAQVPRCYDDETALLRLVAEEASRGHGVLVLPHWGQEYSLTPDARQTALARRLAEAGAMAVVGTHPHVPQPWEIRETPRGRVPVVYSTGNFVAAQPPLERATGVMAWLSLCAGPRGPRVAGAGYVGLQMEFDGADPSLTLPRPGMGARAEAGLALLARLIPGRDLGPQAACTRARRPAAPLVIPDR